jgi:hypothetical protein
MTEVLKAFARDHGGSATAVVSHLGRRGARIVLVGADGIWGDVVADDVESAKAACEAAGVTVAGKWERELAESVRTTADDRRRMGGSR